MTSQRYNGYLGGVLNYEYHLLTLTRPIYTLSRKSNTKMYADIIDILIYIIIFKSYTKREYSNELI